MVSLMETQTEKQLWKKWLAAPARRRTIIRRENRKIIILLITDATKTSIKINFDKNEK